MDIVPEYVQHIIRNYIDKYKNNVNFIMSCNNQKRVIDSIQSRLAIVRLDIPADISPLIRKNSRCREYRVDREYREFLVKYSNYSIRTIINYLENKNTGEHNHRRQLPRNHSGHFVLEFDNYFGFVKSADYTPPLKY
jgi:DNA polymerase III delta prime subunit